MERKASGKTEGFIAERLLARLKLGADRDLLALFGRDRDDQDDDAAEIDSGRQELFAQGIFTQADLPDVDAAAAEVLAVTDHGEVIFPAFQFEGTNLHPVIAEVNRIIKSTGEMLAWEHGYWWVSNTGLLDGRTPLETLMAGDFEALLEAAKKEMEAVEF